MTVVSGSDSSQPLAIVRPRTNNAGHVRAVAVVVLRVVIVIDEIPATPIVDVAVAIVVETVGRAAGAHFATVQPHQRAAAIIAAKLGVSEVDAAIDHSDDDIRIARRDGPGFGGVDVGIGHPDVAVDNLSSVVEAPLRRVLRIGGNLIQRHHKIRLGILDARVEAQFGQHKCEVFRGCFNELEIDLLVILQLVERTGCQRFLPRLLGSLHL